MINKLTDVMKRDKIYIAVYKKSDDGFNEMWEIDKCHENEIVSLMERESFKGLYDLLCRHGKKKLDNCDYWFQLE